MNRITLELVNILKKAAIDLKPAVDTKLKQTEILAEVSSDCLLITV